MIREVVIPLSVGLALFFFGMEVMRTGLSTLAGKRLEEWLAKFTRTPALGFVTGTVATAILQSSSVVTVLTVGLANARLITFVQSIGIILGTNVGTTVTGQLIALPIEQYALPLLFLALFLWIIPWPPFRFSGLTLGGLSCLLIGLTAIRSIAGPLASSPVIGGWFAAVGNSPLLGILAGAAVTALIHSSAAMTAITMAFVEENLLPLSGAVAVILGSNIGTCITAYLASLGGSRAGKLVAYAHILLNLFGVLFFLPLIKPLTLAVLCLSADPGSQVAHAQTIFNAVTSLLVLPFARQFGAFTAWLAQKGSRDE